MSPQPKIQTTSIVVVGNFTPTIFQPSWFAANDLITKQEAEAATVEIIAPPIAQFDAEWLRISVTQDRFMAQTAQEPYYEPLRDLVISVFTLLNHTPVKAMGINQNFHYQFKDSAAEQAFGNRLAPKTDWEDVLTDPKFNTLFVRGERPDEFNGYIFTRAEFSTKIRPGAFIEINDHYQLAFDTETVEAEIIPDILGSHWAESMARGRKIVEKIISLGDFK